MEALLIRSCRAHLTDGRSVLIGIDQNGGMHFKFFTPIARREILPGVGTLTPPPTPKLVRTSEQGDTLVTEMGLSGEMAFAFSYALGRVQDEKLGHTEYRIPAFQMGMLLTP